MLNVKRLTRIVEKDNDKIFVPKQSVIVTFAGLVIPSHVYINYTRCATEPYYPKVTQCLRCLRYGHISKQCNAKAKCCKTCGEVHEANSPVECNTYCFYCKSNLHKTVSKEYPHFKKQTEI